MPNPLLKFIQRFVDRHGHARYYFRRAGFERVPLPGLYGSPEFISAYMDCMAGQPPRPVTIIEREAKPGTLNSLAINYYNSTAFRSMKLSTQRVYRNIIDRLRKEHGDKLINAGKQKIERKHIELMVASRADKPGSANNLRKALKAMMSHAVAIGMLNSDPTQGVRAIPLKGDGFHSWTEEEIAQFEAFHPVGSKARLALALLLNSGQRRSDVVRMGRQHLRKGDDPRFEQLLHVKQAKTGIELLVPVLSQLGEIITASTTGQMTFLVTDYGKPFTPAGFGNWFREQCDKAGLPQCSAHGLRKACARRLADAGCTEHEIAAITGHASLREVQRYTKGANQRLLAISAMKKLENKTCSEVSTPDRGLTLTGKLS